MDKILTNSLNNKILILAAALLFLGLLLQGFKPETPDYHSKVYTHEAIPVQEEIKGEKKKPNHEGMDIMFLPLDEVERVLNESKFEELYVKTDPNFEEKVENVKKYMEGRGTPLADQARYIVIMANKFEIDYRIVAAISVIESSGGIHLYRPYNAWGWGGSKGFTFENWEHSIYVVSRGLGGYYARGENTPEKMAPRYNPHTPNEWSSKVRTVMNRIGTEL